MLTKNGVPRAALGFVVGALGALTACVDSNELPGVPDAGEPPGCSPVGVELDDAATPGNTVPPVPRVATAGTSIGTTFAVHELFLGDTGWDGHHDSNAWAALGANIDGKITTCASANVCTLRSDDGATSSVQVDGVGGIDNSFGANLWPLFNDVMAGATRVDNHAIDKGGSTLLLNLTGLDSSPTQTATGLSAQAFLSAPQKLAGSAWTTSDRRELLDVLLASRVPPFESAERFSDAYVVDGTWVSGPPGELTLPIVVDPVPLDLLVHHAVITFHLATPTRAANGVISGILFTSELEAAFGSWIARVAPTLCPRTVLGPIFREFASFQDIHSDGTNEPGQPCDAISLGVGFTADAIAAPTAIAPKASAEPDPSAPDAGPPACDGG
jgi:hypothetical protein